MFIILIKYLNKPSFSAENLTCGKISQNPLQRITHIQSYSIISGDAVEYFPSIAKDRADDLTGERKHVKFLLICRRKSFRLLKKNELKNLMPKNGRTCSKDSDIKNVLN